MKTVNASPRSRGTFFQVLLRAAAVVLLSLLGNVTAHAQLIFTSTVTAVPAVATPDGTVTITASRLSGSHAYSVRLVPLGGGAATVLFTQTSSADSLRRNVVIPALPAGKYTLELRADSSTIDTASFGVVAPVTLSFTPTTAAPGASVKFTASGLTPGSLVLDYDGAPAFGPVSVSGTSYTGKFRVPTDRPTQLPASVAMLARNLVGRIVPRVGDANFSTKAANTAPFAGIVNTTPSTGAPPRGSAFDIHGKLAFNEAAADEVSVSQYWMGADGSVLPLGASNFTVQANGDFTSTQRTPQFGTMSAMQPTGPGQFMTVSQFRDANGALQFSTSNPGNLTAAIDVDDAVDVTLLMRGNGTPLKDVRIDLSTEDAAALFGDPNSAPVNIDGSGTAPTATQYNTNPQMSPGCPAGVQRKYSDATGRAEFEFAVDPPQAGYNLDGTPVHQATIAPSQNCIPKFGGDGRKIGEFCTVVDPAGLAFTLAIRSAHLGYGYRDAQGGELPVMIDVRVDRNTGQIRTTTCKPGQSCTVQTYTRSATLTINQPALADSGLDIGDPYFQGDADSATIAARPGQAAGANPYHFQTLADLTPFAGAATFGPLRPPTLRFAYRPGAGRPLREAHLMMEKNSGGYEPVGDFQRESDTATCDSADGVEVWKLKFANALSSVVRFPRQRWSSKHGDFQACGFFYGSDTVGHGFARQFCLHWDKVAPELLSLESTQIEDAIPTSVRISGLRTFDGGATHSGAPPAEYHVGARDNSLGSGGVFTYCVPVSYGAYCQPSSAFAQQHEQFSHDAAPQQTDTTYGDGQTNVSNDWHDLFNVTVPLFRWYWGVPELLSAEVFADLGLRAQALLNVQFDPKHPDQFSQTVGGAMSVTMWIGVDIDVLFGILVDAGAMISGSAVSSIVTHADANGGSVDPCFAFVMNFTGWLEIGCPIPNPFDPTCYIPDINESFNIINARDPDNCALPPQQSAGTISAALSNANSVAIAPPPIDPITPEERRALYRHPAIAFDGDGNGLALWLDASGQLVSGQVLGRTVGTAHDVVSTGWGIRDVAVAFLGPNRAVAVWSENALSGDTFRRASLATKARNQRLRYATWNGSDWSAVADLTAAGFGEGQVRLARCTSLTLDCPRTGLVTAVWQRNTGRDIYAASMHIFTADFAGSGWTVPTQIDQSGSLNITPTLVYQGGKPLVGWVRHDPGATLSDVTRRRFTYRLSDGHSLEHVDATLPAGIAAPMLASVDSNSLALTFTLVDPGYGFVGTRQAVHLGSADCSGGVCNFSAWKMRDARGRAIYGERPQLLIDEEGNAVVTVRGLAFGTIAGNPVNLYDDDPPGMKSTTGDLIQLRSPLSDQRVPVIALSRDAATHFQPTAAVNPVSGEVVALSVKLASPTTFALEAQPTSLLARQPQMASITAVGDGVELAAATLAPDLTIETMAAVTPKLTPGSVIAVSVGVVNQGSEWTPDAARTATLKLWWDNPQTRMATPVVTNIAAISAAGRRTLLVNVPVPAAFHEDERQTLHASIVTSAAAIEMDGDNNDATRNLGGMPEPRNPRVVLAPGTRFTHLAWDATTDARVKGYRVYVEDEPGKVRPLGSSFNAGFVDLAAQYGVPRRYYVSTYSARGVESERVGPLVAAPAPPTGDTLFADDFQPAAP